MDVVGLPQHGLANAEATLGTYTTPFHIQKLLRASNTIVFSFDGDKAGRKAARRALESCLTSVRYVGSIRFLFLPAAPAPAFSIKAYGAVSGKVRVREKEVN